MVMGAITVAEARPLLNVDSFHAACSIEALVHLDSRNSLAFTGIWFFNLHVLLLVPDASKC